jgi:hypothetical protein
LKKKKEKKMPITKMFVFPAGNMEARVVAPGDMVEYTFQVPALGENDEPCITSTYQSAVDPFRDLSTGLVGPLLICQRGQLTVRCMT